MYQTGSLSQNGNTRNDVGYFFLTGLVCCWGWVTPHTYTTSNFKRGGVFFIWTGI